MIDHAGVKSLLAQMSDLLVPGRAIEVDPLTMGKMSNLLLSARTMILILDQERLRLDDKLEQAMFAATPIISGGTGASSDSTDLRIVAMELATQSPSCKRGAPEAAVAADILVFLRKCETPAEAPVAAPTNERHYYDDLSVSYKDDGTWLTFKASGGRSASINVQELAKRYPVGGVIYTALMQWCSDRIPF